MFRARAVNFLPFLFFISGLAGHKGFSMRKKKKRLVICGT